MLPRYTKLSTCSTALPSTVMLGGCGPEPMFWILVFAQETHRPSVDDEQLSERQARPAMQPVQMAA